MLGLMATHSLDPAVVGLTVSSQLEQAASSSGVIGYGGAG